MSITESSTVADIYAELKVEAADIAADIEAWQDLECNASCMNTIAGYVTDNSISYYFRMGLFGWTNWDSFYDYCLTATTECSGVYAVEDYDGWSLGQAWQSDAFDTDLAEEYFWVCF
jgi:hypothetical protein